MAAYIEAAIRDELLTSTTVISLVGSAGVYVLEAPQNVAYPYGVLRTVSDPVNAMYFSAVNTRQPRIQIDWFSDDSVECLNLENATITALRQQQGTIQGIAVEIIMIENRHQIREPIDGVYHSVVDIIVEYEEP